MMFWKWCEWAEKRGLGQRGTVAAEFLGFCTVTLCVVLSAHHSAPLMHYLEPLHKVSEGQTQPSLMVSTALLV